MHGATGCNRGGRGSERMAQWGTEGRDSGPGYVSWGFWPHHPPGFQECQGTSIRVQVLECILLQGGDADHQASKEAT